MIFFDLAGVVFANGSKALRERLVDQFQVLPEAADAILSGPEAWAARRGEMSPEQFWQSVGKRARQAGLPPHFDLRLAWYEAFTATPGIFALLGALGRRYRLGIISETMADRAAWLEQRFAYEGFFGLVIYSFREGCDKRDGALFQVAIEGANEATDGRSHIMIEDDLDSANHARALGMTTLIFRSTDQLAAELADLGIATGPD